jgi:hypothetical protein
MRIILIFLDLGLLGWIIYALIDEFNLIGLLVAILIALNIIYILRRKHPSGKYPSNWLSLYFKRKALEEKKKIEELSPE